MAGEKVREAIADLRRRGTDRLDDLIGILRRGPAAVTELAQTAADTEFDNQLHALVRANGQRFAVTVASLPGSVRQHPLVVELLAALGGRTLATAAITAWDEGRFAEAAFLADAGAAGGEGLIITARRALADKQTAAATAAYGQALREPLAPTLVIEAARALHATGDAATGLAALAAEPTSEAVAALSELVALGCLNANDATITWLAAQPTTGLDRLRSAVIAAASRTGHQLLAGIHAGLVGVSAATDRLSEAFRADILSPQREVIIIAATEARLAVMAAVALVSAVCGDAPRATSDGPPELARLFADCCGAADGLGELRAPLRADLEQLAALFDSIQAEPPSPSAGLRLARRIANRLDECRAALAVATASGQPLSQRLGELPTEVEREVRVPLGDQGIAVRSEAKEVPGVACDRARLGWALVALTQSLAAGQPTRQVTLSIEFAAAAEAVIFSIQLLSAIAAPSGDGAAVSTSSAFVSAVIARIVSECEGEVVIAPNAAGVVARVSLPVSAAEAELARLAGISNEARMALRAAEGMLAEGNAEMAAFLAERAVLTEAAILLKPLLARHALLPRAVWALAAPAQLRASLLGNGAGLPPLPGRRVEELCRLVTADRLGKRLTSLVDYADAIRLFALSHAGWPEHGGLPGLSQSAAERLVASCLATAAALAVGGSAAVAAARQTLAALLACRGRGSE